MGIHCKGSVCERECEDSRQLKTKEVLVGSLREAFPRSEACALHMTGIRRVVTAGFHECLTGKAFPRDTHEIFYFVNLSYLIHPISTHTIYTPITHIC